MKKIAITGPTGAIGVALVNECITQGIEVYALCRKTQKEYIIFLIVNWFILWNAIYQKLKI